MIIYVWVRLMHHGIPAGVAHGFESVTEATQYVESRRWARDNDPVWSAFKDGYDWEVAAPGPETSD